MTSGDDDGGGSEFSRSVIQVALMGTGFTVTQNLGILTRSLSDVQIARTLAVFERRGHRGRSPVALAGLRRIIAAKLGCDRSHRFWRQICNSRTPSSMQGSLRSSQMRAQGWLKWGNAFCILHLLGDSFKPQRASLASPAFLLPLFWTHLTARVD